MEPDRGFIDFRPLREYLPGVALKTGTRLGPYEIGSPLGAGGMGEVYLAKDTRLDRTVAIKVLPSHLSGDPELRQRFEREARAVSSLNHPHICTLHDIGREGNVDFLVMEHLEGETLAERLKKGPLPFHEALPCAVQIADALDKAHRQGVVHRDLKPGNIMLTKTGAKLLDFGLAKLAGTTAATPNISTLSALPTEQRSLTAAGAILGTFQYMAPEQLEGGEIDARTDIFALGAVIYEMVTGAKAFEGKSQASLISAIMSANPAPMSSLQAFSPPALERVVRTCLAKDPDKRWQNAGDVARELEWIAQAGPQGAVVERGLRARLPWVVPAFVAGIVAAAVVGWAFFPLASPPPAHVTRFSIPFTNERWSQNGVALSPDGSHAAYIAIGLEGQRLYIRRMDQVVPIAVQGTDGATNPFFSPDGQWVGFWAANKLQKVSVGGGLPLALCDSTAVRGASWGEDDMILFGVPTATGQGLSQVPAGGGTPEAVTQLVTDRGDVSHRFPDILPDGDVVFTILTGTGSSVAVLSRETGEIRTLIEDAVRAVYAPTGHLVYTQAGQLLAVPFDGDRLEVTGPPVPLVDEVAPEEFAISKEGALLYGQGTAALVAEVELLSVDRQGTARPLTEKPGPYVEPRLSPDGRHLAVTVAGETGIDIWVLELERDALTRLTFEQGNDSLPIWTPDGKQVTFSSDREGGWNVFSVPADGSGQPVQLTKSEYPTTATSWTPDGKVLATQQGRPNSGLDVAIFRLDGDGPGEPEVLLGTPFNEAQPIFSPDGHWLAYTSDESGRAEVYVRPFPGPGGKSQVSTEGGGHPLWAGNGRELFYLNGDKMMAVSLSTEPELRPSRPTELFEGRYGQAPLFIVQELLYHDVARDGQHFVMIKPVESESEPTQLDVVLNWFEELKARVPTE